MATFPTAPPASHVQGADTPTAAPFTHLARDGGAVQRRTPGTDASQRAPARRQSPRLRTEDLADIHRLVASDFHQVNALIPHQLTSDVGLVEAIGEHIIGGGGKRLRPLIVLLAARCCGYEATDHVRLATIIEFLHTATLLHDDVVDGSALRRGRATANATWGNAPSVLVGDFLYSRAFQLMVTLDRMDVMAILAEATNIIAEGEVLQLDNLGNAALTEAAYMEVVRCKTALLFQASAHTAAVLALAPNPLAAALRDYGLHFGLAYQLVDDWLDYAGDSAVMGKHVGDDLAEGKATLPLIHTMRHGSPADAAVVREALEQRRRSHLNAVLNAVRRSGALDYTRSRAQAFAAAAREGLAALPPNIYREALQALAGYAVARMR